MPNPDPPAAGQPKQRGVQGAAAPGRDRGEPAALALRMEDLTLWVLQRVTKFPRDHKFTVGDRLTETCLDTTALLVEASFVRSKLDLLASASRGLTRARVLVRLAQRLGLLSADQRAYFAGQTDELGRMLGGWTRSLQSRDTRPATPPGAART